MTGLLLRDMNLSNPSVNPFVLLALKKKKVLLVSASKMYRNLAQGRHGHQCFTACSKTCISEVHFVKVKLQEIENHPTTLKGIPERRKEKR